jgi:hypothetical protein
MRALLIEDPSDSPALAVQFRTWQAKRAVFSDAAVGLSGVLRTRTWEVLAQEIVQAMQSTGPPTRSASY